MHLRSGQGELIASLALLAVIGILIVGITLPIERPAGGLLRPLKDTTKTSQPTQQTAQTCTQEICDRKDNDCDGKIDETIECIEKYILSQNILRESNFNRFLDLVKNEKWIIELEDKPVIEYKRELERQKRIATISNLKDYRNKLLSEHDLIKIELANRKITPKRDFINTINGIAVSASYEDLEEIKRLPNVKAVYEDKIVNTTLMDSVPLINADDVWFLQDSQQRNITGQGIKIGIIDTGVDYTHPDLGGCFGLGCKVTDGYDFVNNDNDPMDDYGHGTHVASIAAGNGTLKGVAPDAKIYAYKVIDANGGGTFSDVIAGIERSTDPNSDGDFSDHIDVISMSLGAPGDPDDLVSKASDNAAEIGVVVVAAAGNSGNYNYLTIGSPGTSRKAITVGASDKADLMAYFSSKGPTAIGSTKPDVVAPGMLICAARMSTFEPWLEKSEYKKCVDDSHVLLSGTSMATPHVAGAAALIKQSHPDWTPQEIKNTIKGTAIDLGNDSLTQGSGRVDVLKAVQANKPYPTAVLDSTDIFVSGIIDIIGTAYSLEFKNYTLEYGLSLNPAEYILITNSATPVQNGILGTLNIDNIESKEITIRLTVYDNNNQKSVDYLLLLKKLDFWKAGWPQRIATDSLYLQFSPVYGDLNNDGKMEIVASSPGITESAVYVFDINGNLLPGWPQQVNLFGGSTPALGDVDGDGDLEIAYKSSSFYFGNKSTVYVWNHDGTPLNSHWPKDITYEIVSLWSPTLSDIDNDGKDEIIVGTFSGGIKIWNEDGSEIYGNWNNIVTAFSDAAVADLDRDRNKEIIFIDSSDELYVWRNDGSILTGFPIILPKSLELGISPVIGDINDDGYNDIIVLGGLYQDNLCSLAVYDKNGHVLEGNWPVNFYCNIHSSPVLADFDKDNNLEIVVITLNKLYIFDNKGKIIGESPFISNDFITNHPIIGDVDGDKDSEIISSIGTSSDIFAWHHNGSLVEGWPKRLVNYSITKNLIMVGPSRGSVIGDIDMDGKNELILILFSGILTSNPANIGTRVFVVDLNGDSKELEWPMWMHDAKHTGLYSLPGDNPPNVILNYPKNNNIVNKVIFNCSANDDFGLKSISLYTDTGGEWSLYETRSVSGNDKEAVFTIGNVLDGTYKWNCLAYDNTNHADWSDNYTFVVDTKAPVIELIMPENNGFIGSTNVNFECKISEDVVLNNVSLYGSWGTGWGSKKAMNDLSAGNKTDHYTTIRNLNGSYITIIQPDGLFGKDTEIEKAVENNHGTTSVLTLYNDSGYVQRIVSLLRFDITDILPYSTIESAEFGVKILYSARGPKNINLFRLEKDWIEGNGTPKSGATWLTYDGVNNWTSPGGDFDPYIYDTYEVIGEVGSIVFDIKRLVHEWVSGIHNDYGILLSETVSRNAETDFYSSDDTYPNSRPKLIVTYKIQNYSGIFNITIPGNGTYRWNCQACDSAGNCNFADSDYIISVNYNLQCGDVNGDGKIALSDIIYIINYLFKGGPAPIGNIGNISTGDVNGDGKISLSDIILIVNYLFKGGAKPTCGAQQTTTSETASYQLVQTSSSNINLNGNLQIPVAGLQLELLYDPAKLTVFNVTNTSRTRSLNIVVDKSTAGRIKVGVYDLGGSKAIPSGSGTLLTIRFSGNPSAANLRIASPVTVNTKALELRTSVLANKFLTTTSKTIQPVA